MATTGAAARGPVGKGPVGKGPGGKAPATGRPEGAARVARAGGEAAVARTVARSDAGLGGRPGGEPVGVLLRRWRELRRLSQLELALRAEISARHLSFLETGRSRPSAEMLLRLSEHLDIPLRRRNELLLAAGHAPAYPRTPLGAPPLAPVLAAARRLLRAHEPYPALLVDRCWDLVEANASLDLFVSKADPRLLEPPVNVLRLSLHPDGLAPHIVNLGEWRAHLLGRLRHQVRASADPDLAELLAELTEYPCDQPQPPVDLPGPGDVVVPLRFRHEAAELAFLSTTSVFGTPVDVTVAELALESFFPADDDTAAALRRLARAADGDEPASRAVGAADR
ncbi:helix-turn-helix domain-containing protein [Frankia nepalensis]|nr:helix-turn-helix domain-containing protein [Frankia nepalensis]